MRVKFYKYSANGNDFIILDHPEQVPEHAQMAQLCDRHFSVGADGVLVLNSAPGADGRMRIFNPDGAEAEMCANGLRCLVTHVDLKAKDKKESYLIHTMNGSYECHRKGETFCLKMSEIKDKNIYDLPFKEFSHTFYIHTGVPHLVCYVSNIKMIVMKSLAPQYRFHPLFPYGANVSFVEKLEGEQTAYVRTYERGVENETYSCGTGLTATALALQEWFGWRDEIKLFTRGGEHTVLIGIDVFYWGEVKFCFEGELTL